MPLQALHSHYWAGAGEPPPTPGMARRLTLLKAGHGFIAILGLIWPMLLLASS